MTHHNSWRGRCRAEAWAGAPRTVGRCCRSTQVHGDGGAHSATASLLHETRQGQECLAQPCWASIDVQTLKELSCRPAPGHQGTCTCCSRLEPRHHRGRTWWGRHTAPTGSAQKGQKVVHLGSKHAVVVPPCAVSQPRGAQHASACGRQTPQPCGSPCHHWGSGTLCMPACRRTAACHTSGPPPDSTS